MKYTIIAIFVVVIICLLYMFKFSEFDSARPSNLPKIATLQLSAPCNLPKVATVQLPAVGDGSQTKCSLPFLKNYAATYHNYPTLAFQTVARQLTDAEIRRQSKSASCWFPMQFDKKSATKSWKNPPTIDVKRIVMFGDSNGGRYLNSILKFLQETTWSCDIIKQETTRDEKKNKSTAIPTISYFVREPWIKLQHLQVRLRDCYSCLSTLVQCKLPQSNVSTAMELSIEYIVLEFTMDTEVTTQRTLWAGTCQHGFVCEHSATYQEFILKEYLRGQYPDVVFYFANFHDIIRYNSRHLRQNFDFLFGLMDIYLPMNTTAMFMTVHKQDLTRASPEWQRARYDDGKLSCNDALQKQNSIMYEALDKYLVSPDRQWYAFPNLFDTSNNTDHLYDDSMHRLPVWYDHIMCNLLYLLTT